MDFNAIRQMRIVYQVPGMEQIQAQRDLVYKQVEGQDLRLDVYLPNDERSGLRPAVLLVHGDLPPELIIGTKDHGPFVSLGQLVAASGLAAVTFDHRSTEQFTKMEQVGSDIEDLIAFVRNSGPSLGIDPERLCVWAFSAGVPYGVQVALRQADIRCIVAYYGPLDLQILHGHLPPVVTAEALRVASPLARIEEMTSIPPLLVARAGKDQEWINIAIDRFVQQAQERNLPIELLTHDEGPHAFEIFDDSERSREIVRQTLDFIKQQLS
ncbi:MAG: alpha/beta hydrolase [Chloroflexi bacterium]|nr:alpha/beta hydrolase [Chloroflexota bacterium]